MNNDILIMIMILVTLLSVAVVLIGVALFIGQHRQIQIEKRVRALERERR